MSTRDKTSDLARNLDLDPNAVQRGMELLAERMLLVDPAVEDATNSFLHARDLTILRELIVGIMGEK